MAPPILDYASPPHWKLEWQFLRSTAAVLLFVFGWFCFSLYVWLRFDSGSIGRMPDLRIARDLCVPQIVAATLMLTGLNCAYLTIRLAYLKRPLTVWLFYLSLVLLPVAGLFANEYLFGDFTVA